MSGGKKKEYQIAHMKRQLDEVHNHKTWEECIDSDNMIWPSKENHEWKYDDRKPLSPTPHAHIRIKSSEYLQEAPKPKSTQDRNGEVIIPSKQIHELAACSHKARDDTHHA